MNKNLIGRNVMVNGKLATVETIDAFGNLTVDYIDSGRRTQVTPDAVLKQVDGVWQGL